MQFEYDLSKSAANLEKHGIDFEDVQEIWDGVYCRIDAMYVSGERRELVVGRISGEYWTAITTDRGNAARLISARRSTEKERGIYEKNYNSRGI